MKLTKKIDVGDYIVEIVYDDNGSGYIKVIVFDELEQELEHIEITNDVDDDENDNDIKPFLN